MRGYGTSTVTQIPPCPKAIPVAEPPTRMGGSVEPELYWMTPPPLASLTNRPWSGVIAIPEGAPPMGTGSPRLLVSMAVGKMPPPESTARPCPTGPDANAVHTDPPPRLMVVAWPPGAHCLVTRPVLALNRTMVPLSV